MTDLRLLARGPLEEVDASVMDRLLKRGPEDDTEVAEAVAGLICDVRTRGDAALVEMAARYDGAHLEKLEVPRAAWEAALAGLTSEVRSALERAAKNIRRFHEAQVPDDVSVDIEPGVTIARRWTSLERVGVYAPGGTAAYPSSVLMGVVPARAAGVGEVVVCSPPSADGAPPPAVLAAAAIAGADRVFALGGAGAVAALAYGTESVPVADAIVGPGNRWVTEAKRQVAGHVVIDAPAGPSEVLVLADGSTDPRLAALELVAQAEHDPDAACVLISTSQQTVERVCDELDTIASQTPRSETVLAALGHAGAALWTESPEAAIDFANRYAAEHASVLTADAATDAARLTTSGTVFVGPHASVAFGDYLTGANHVLPTEGRARSFSGLSTLHFLRSFTVQEVSAQGAAGMADDVVTLATAEGLPAHAAAARARGAM